jgi:hypothetical protein
MANAFPDLDLPDTPLPNDDETDVNGPKPDADRIDQDANKDKDDIAIDDDMIDATLGAKPKRGRGRPPVQKKKDEDLAREIQLVTKENQQMKRDLEALRADNDRISGKLVSCSEDLRRVEKDYDIVRSQLSERETDYMELLEQVSLHEEKVNENMPSGIICVDGITERLVEHLPSKIQWRKEICTIDEVTSLEGVKDADVIVILCGVEEIANGSSGIQAFNILKKSVEALAPCGPVYICCLPPNRNSAVQVDLFNHKLANFEPASANIHVLKIKTYWARALWLEIDGVTPSQKCIKLYNEALKSEIVPPSAIKTKASTRTSPVNDFATTVFFPVKQDLMGLVIGKKGNVIKKITESCDVKITVGKWQEGKDESEDYVSGILVSGKVSDVQEAIKCVTKVVASAGSTREPMEKKRKF